MTMSNQRPVRHCRETLQIAVKPRLVGWETWGVRTEAPLRLGGGGKLVLDRVLRKFLPATRSK